MWSGIWCWDHVKTKEIHGWSSKIVDILLKKPGLENSPLKANIEIHIFYKSLVYFMKQKQF
jgi:hypothetical protein